MPEPGKGTEKPKTKIDQLEDSLLEMIDLLEKLSGRMDKLEKTAVKKAAGLFGGKRGRVAIKDTQTGVVYISKSAVGKALAGEADTDPLDHFAWYKLQAKFPERFVEASEEEKTKVEAVEKARIEAEVAAANKAAAAEEKGK